MHRRGVPATSWTLEGFIDYGSIKSPFCFMAFALRVLSCGLKWDKKCAFECGQTFTGLQSPGTPSRSRDHRFTALIVGVSFVRKLSRVLTGCKPLGAEKGIQWLTCYVRSALQTLPSGWVCVHPRPAFYSSCLELGNAPTFLSW